MAKLKVYSKAFFDIALETRNLDKYFEENTFVLDTIKKDRDLKNIISHPEVSSDEKMNILKDLFGNKINQDFLGLFNTILQKRREIHLVDILDGFNELVLKHKNITVAQIFSAAPLSENQAQKITEKLTKLLGKDSSDQIILDIKIMPELVAGLRIIADGAVIDSSFKKQLAGIKQHMHASLSSQQTVAKEVS